MLKIIIKIKHIWGQNRSQSSGYRCS